MSGHAQALEQENAFAEKRREDTRECVSTAASDALPFKMTKQDPSDPNRMVVNHDKMTKEQMAVTRRYLMDRNGGAELRIEDVTYDMLSEVQDLVCRWLRPKEVGSILGEKVAKETPIFVRDLVLDNKYVNLATARHISGKWGAFFSELTREHELFYVWFDLERPSMAAGFRGACKIRVYGHDRANVDAAVEDVRARIASYNEWLAEKPANPKIPNERRLVKLVVKDVRRELKVRPMNLLKAISDIEAGLKKSEEEASVSPRSVLPDTPAEGTWADTMDKTKGELSEDDRKYLEAEPAFRDGLKIGGAKAKKPPRAKKAAPTQAR